MAASPDGELLLLATGFGQLLVMTQDWDLLYEVTLDEGLAASVSFCHFDPFFFRARPFGFWSPL